MQVSGSIPPYRLETLTARLDRLQRKLAKLGLAPMVVTIGAEIVTHDPADVVTRFQVEDAFVIAAGEVLDVFDDHSAGIGFNIPGIIPGKGRCCHSRSGQGHPNDQFPHYSFPFLR